MGLTLKSRDAAIDVNDCRLARIKYIHAGLLKTSVLIAGETAFPLTKSLFFLLTSVKT